ncbi:spermidine synthase [Phycicoccus sp. BSK3Z-2]|uniref:Spermidine synthase n=1 Tax=Phycicoccus avicenniae TaxID=2828860 RepID=A0A941I0G0_9MICO|nr:spermidine synthase [Phycicoccus avicenniae]MBR7743089.1 spermidine synthase [Phycicoccus avicenniae]
MEPDPPLTLAREATPHGEVVLRRRGAVLELVVDGAFAMDTVDTTTEVRLAEAALTRHQEPERVLVGGLGLGFTARAVLADPRVRRVDVVELAEPLVRWAREGLVPELAGLEGERCRLVADDVAHVLTGAGSPPGPWDVVLLDVDNGPGFLLHPGNAALYERSGLAALRRSLAPGGVGVVWSSHPAPDLLAGLRSVAAPGDEVEETALVVHREGRELTYSLSVLHRAPGTAG